MSFGLTFADATTQVAVQIDRATKAVSNPNTARDNLTIGGRTVSWGPALGRPGNTLDVQLDDGTVLIVYVADPARYPLEEVTKLVEQADLTQVFADPTTWTPATAALP